MASKPIPEDERIYISQLAQIVDRQVGTIRKWEELGKLPKHLLPKRGYRTWRYWSHSQVYGPRGIIAWMKRNDMRPGNQLTDPKKEGQHVRNLRRPKYLNGHHINTAKRMIEQGKTAQAIAKKIHPRTRYSSVENTEIALRRYFESTEVTNDEGERLTFPKPARKQRVTDPLLTKVNREIRKARAA